MGRKTSWLAALALVALAGTALAQGDVIAERRAGLKRMGGHMEAMKAVVDSRGDVKPLEARVDDMIAWFTRMPALFPAGSGTGDTKALPAIWQDFSKFEEADRTLLGHLRVMKTAAAAGDTAAFATAYQATGPQYCGNCHRPFRAR
ncbi:c-type cytochrome [Roseicella aquatilis]|uniref:Cytochrome c n=1 Tax=Roseicella aquatilis TaxID=2527868 RepID=A0A4R4DV20_9PROT|nr:cytochrome c [Roseicella aquatilis]TCZ65930.1 cytochrome c [Roseicella aquatilis]